MPDAPPKQGLEGDALNAPRSTDIDPPPPPPFTASAAVADSDSDSDGVSTSENNATTNGPNLLPLILAPILSVFVLAALVGVCFYFYKRKRAKRVAPSAEFTKYQRAPIPLADVEGSAAVGVRGMRSIDNRPASYALQNNGEEEADGDAPPAFTPGLFKDPIFEKGVAMSWANQGGGQWAGRHGHTSGTMGTTTTGGAGDVHTERQDSLPLAGDSPASLSSLAQGQGLLERQRLIPPGE
jgi:hypothetical protein